MSSKHITTEPPVELAPVVKVDYELIKNPFNEVGTLYLNSRGFGADTFPILHHLGATAPDINEASQFIQRTVAELEQYDDFIKLPQRTYLGEIIQEHGQLLALKKKIDILGTSVVADKINPYGMKSPAHVSFFGDEIWTGYDGEIWVDEAWLKGAMGYIYGGQMCIAQGGINTTGYTGQDGEKYIIPELSAPMWSPKAKFNIRYDYPKANSPKSRSNTRDAIANMAYLMGKHCEHLYDATIPAPPDNRNGQDLNAYIKRHGAVGFGLIRRARKLIRTDYFGGLKVHTVEEILARRSPLWIVKGMVPANEHALIAGAFSCGKTFFAMDLGMAIAREDKDKWFGKRVKKHGLVVHITLEGHALKNRIKAYQKHYDLKPEDIKNYRSIETPINLREPETAERIIEAVRDVEQETEQQVALIIIDTLNRALAGGDENSSVDIGAYMTNAEEVKAAFPDSSLVSVHHLGKDKSRGPRGHSSLEGNVGAELLIEKDQDGQRTVKIIKMRDGADGLEFFFTLGVVELGKDADGDEESSCYVFPVQIPESEGGKKTLAMKEGFYNWWTGNQDSKPFTTRTVVRTDMNKVVSSIKEAAKRIDQELRLDVSRRELEEWLKRAERFEWIYLVPEHGKSGIDYFVCKPLDEWRGKY